LEFGVKAQAQIWYLEISILVTGSHGRKLTVSQLSNTDETRHILVEHLESTAVLFGLARIAETTWAVQDLEEGIEVD
jgi:hypothetical protein